MTATFRIRSMFPLTGRGVVVAGDIVDGVVKPGMKLVLRSDALVPIQSVEFIDKADGKFEIGLLIRAEDAKSARLSEGLAVEDAIEIVE